LKTYKNLYPQVLAWDNLYLAYRKARKGKRARVPVATFEWDLEGNLVRLQDELATKSYRPGPYHSFYIHEPKRRLISAAPFRDRVVHHALCNVIEPISERRFIHDSYANRVGKGTHRALDRCQAHARRYRYVLPCDVRQFFPSIDHRILRGILGRVLADADVMWLVDLFLQSGAGVLSEAYDMQWFPDDDLLAAVRPRGLPIGNLTSQFWANVYLNELDQYVKRGLRCPAYLRYVDDILLFDDDIDQLWAWRAGVESCLARLRLTLHGKRAHPRPVTEGIPFLGFVVYPTHRRLKRRKGILFRRRLRERLAAHRRGELTFEELDASIQGWVSHVRHGDTWGLRRSLFRSIILPRSANSYPGGRA
jgi:retron-type reverse transcriptase